MYSILTTGAPQVSETIESPTGPQIVQSHTPRHAAMPPGPNEQFLTPGRIIGVGLAGVALLGVAQLGDSDPLVDISHPQCDGKQARAKLPEDTSKVIVGFNKGVGMSRNPCFSDQMKYAEESSGEEPEIYVNSGNPGFAIRAKLDKKGRPTVPACADGDSVECAIDYGKRVTQWNLDQFKKVYGDKHGVKASDFRWWVDVEAGSSWECNRNLAKLCIAGPNAVFVDKGAYTRNAGVVFGMISQFQAQDIKTGLYVPPEQWRLIVDNAVAEVPQFASLRDDDVPLWVAGGARNEDEAQERCEIKVIGLEGNTVELSQYIHNVMDARLVDKNVEC